MPFKVVRNDITRMKVDAIVNTANEAPIYSTGVDYAVYKAAGEEELLKAREAIGYLEQGDVAITPGFQLDAKYIIHAVSPMYIDGQQEEEALLRSCYRKSLQLAKEYNCKSIAFPLIATGSFKYPKEHGMRIALDEFHAFLMNNEMLIYLVVFDTRSVQLGLHVYPKLEAYIDHNYVCEKREEEYGDRYFGSVPKDDPGYDAYRMDRLEVERRLAPASLPKEAVLGGGISPFEADESFDLDEFMIRNEKALDERIKHIKAPFREYLMYLIESKNKTNVEVYQKALLTKQHFSKIKKNPNYKPDKSTVLRLCIGLELNLDEAKDLLARAGFALSPCDLTDIIFSFFIENEIYDMFDIDIALEEHGLPCFVY